MMLVMTRVMMMSLFVAPRPTEETTPSKLSRRRLPVLPSRCGFFPQTRAPRKAPTLDAPRQLELVDRLSMEMLGKQARTEEYKIKLRALSGCRARTLTCN